MTDGLITRIGKWIDHKWAAKATWLDVQEQGERCSDRYFELKGQFDKALTEINERQRNDVYGLRKAIMDLTVVVQAPDEVAKEIAELKTRFEKLELYLGMSRKVDPTKPAVAKSAFAM